MRSFPVCLALVVASLVGCAVSSEELISADDSSTDDRAIESTSGSVAVGATLRTTANLNLRAGASTASAIILVIPSGTAVIAAAGAPKNGFYQVRYGSHVGWSSGLFLDRGSSGSGTGSGSDVASVVTRLGHSLESIAPGASVGLGVVFMPTGERWTYHGDLRQQSASAFKLVWAAAALAHSSIDEVRVPAVVGSSVFPDSDNCAAGQLIDLAGGLEGVNSYVRGLGISNGDMRLDHWTYCGVTRTSGAYRDNFFSPNSILTFLYALDRRTALGGAQTDSLLAWAQRSPRSGYGGWLGTQLPAAARASMRHKAGWIPGSGLDTANEIGIVTTPRGDYGVAFVTSYGNFSREAAGIEWASCVVYHAIARDGDAFAPCHKP